MKTIRRHTPIVLFATLLVSLLIGCHGSDDDDPAAAAETLERALAPREVQLVIAEVREERPSVQLVGEIRAFDTVTVSSEVAGKVDRVLVEVGDRVTAGTPLVEVDRETFQYLPAAGRGQPRGRQRRSGAGRKGPRAQARPAVGRDDSAIYL